ncbi:hypothetical protein OM076_30985 [Solirubrobacter ginsenosidimutans]|uniref:Uncharacterized protein n=1 Tax=Solirubrobacter ginsenosidimutans TaxID=490573 RepID=A0A9X3MXT8_9ACTN|nr:hypothetical protein [Solirubrobacter ginsenosidimutans]MDA0164734.1 hypothetical protein [Solirubrobacter ginsenosidimutans]
MPPALVRDLSPYPSPPLGAPVRVAFLGSASGAGAHALHAPANGLQPRFVEVRPGGDPRAALADFAPHVVIALEPGLLAPSALEGVRAATLAVGAPASPDAFAGFDRVLGLPGATGVWRSRPLPVDDRLFSDVTPSRRPPKTLFVGRSTEHREWLLIPAKHDHEVVHFTHGLTGDALARELRNADIGIALTAEPGHGFPAQVLVHLAAGQLLLTEHLHPSCGLESGIDFLELDSRDSLLTILMQAKLHPDAYERVRIRGRMKAEQHRASLVWPRIVGDLLHDLRVFGR